MRGLHMSTGGWIFTGLVTAAILAPTALYATASSTVAIGTTTNGRTANITANHQLLTTTISPQHVVHAYGFANNGCLDVYTPPAGKAIVVTSVTYDMFGNNPGNENIALLTDATCNILYDEAETTLADETESRTFPIGLPMPSVGIRHAGGDAAGAGVWITGYLIPASQLPPAAPAIKLPSQLLHPTH